jgi:hypothetical protein
MNIRIHNSVGKQGKNTAKDVKVVQALLNAYFRNNKINNKMDTHSKVAKIY